MSYDSISLLQEKYLKWRQEPLTTGFSAKPISVSKTAGSGNNFVGLIYNVWECTITSVPNSIWCDGNFHVELRFPQCREDALKIYFKPAIFHPNVNGRSGLVLLPIVNNWKDVDIKDILLGLRHLLDNPKLNGYFNQLNEHAARMYWRNYEKYVRWVRLDIIEYHSEPVMA